jgi:hypothetical protein
MLFQNKISRPTLLVLVLLIITCACARGRIAAEMPSRTYNKPYDAVWEAVTGVILDDLGCAERTLKKNKGYLETEWVHSIDTEGQHCWKIEAYLKKGEGSVLVQLDKIVQLKDDVSQTLNKYSKTAEKTKEPVGPNAGWSDEAAAVRDIEDLYRRIDLRLGQ